MSTISDLNKLIEKIEKHNNILESKKILNDYTPEFSCNKKLLQAIYERGYKTINSFCMHNYISITKIRLLAEHKITNPKLPTLYQLALALGYLDDIYLIKQTNSKSDIDSYVKSAIAKMRYELEI